MKTPICSIVCWTVARRRSGGPSIALDTPDPDSDAFSLIVAASMLLGRQPHSVRDFSAIGKRLAKAVRRRKPYDGGYIRAVIKGDNPMTNPLDIAADNMISELLEEPPQAEYKKVEVLVPNGLEIPAGTVVLKSAVTCICGVSFIPTTWNQVNHSPGCAFRLKNQRRDDGHS